MKIDQGQFVRCSLSSGIVVSGKVQIYSSQEIILFSLDGEKILIIHDPKMVILTEVLLHPPKSQQQIQELKEDFSSQVNQTFLEPNNYEQEITNDQLKNLAQLRKDLLQSEKELIANKLSQERLTAPNITQPSYDQFAIFKSGQAIKK